VVDHPVSHSVGADRDFHYFVDGHCRSAEQAKLVGNHADRSHHEYRYAGVSGLGGLIWRACGGAPKRLRAFSSIE